MENDIPDTTEKIGGVPIKQNKAKSNKQTK